MEEKPNWSKTIAEFLIDNLMVLLTIGFAGYVIYRQEISDSALGTNDLLAAILAVLGFLATSEIIERYRKLNKIEKLSSRSLEFLESRLTEHPSALAFFEKMPVLDGYVQSASEIDLCGVTLTSTINRQFGNLRDRLQSGAKIRIMVIDPDSAALTMSAERSHSPKDIDYYAVRLDATMRDITYLFESWQEFKKLDTKNQKPGELSVRLLSYSPSFGILSFNTNRDAGRMIVELYPHKFGYKSPPTFELIPQRDGNWYRYFSSQFEEMWNAAKPWEPKSK